MQQEKKYSHLSIAVFGRGAGVEYPDCIKFQRLDCHLNMQLASLFRQVILVPIVYGYRSALWENFSMYYRQDLTINNAKIMPAYSYCSFNADDKIRPRIIAWKNWVPAVFKALRSCDLALIFFPSTIGLIGTAIGCILQKPMIAYFGGDWSKPNPKTGKLNTKGASEPLFFCIKALIQKSLIKNMRAILMRDYSMYKVWSQRRNGVYYVPGNMSLSKEHLFVREDTCSGGPIVCLSVAALIPRKGVDDIIKAVGMLKKKGYALKLWHVGGSYEENLNQSFSLCRRLGVEEDVIFHGYINILDDLLSLYRKADIFVLASHSEGYPRSITEAQSQSLPVIATKVGGIALRLEDERHALLVEPGKPEQIAQAIERISAEDELRRRLIAEGFKLAEEELCGASAADVIVNAIQERFPELCTRPISW